MAPIICLHLSLSTSISLSKCIIISLSTISTSIAYISVLLPVYNVCIPHLILSWARRRTSKFCWYCWELSLSRALKPQWLGHWPINWRNKNNNLHADSIACSQMDEVKHCEMDSKCHMRRRQNSICVRCAMGHRYHVS